jgi:hypothetical protein
LSVSSNAYQVSVSVKAGFSSQKTILSHQNLFLNRAIAVKHQSNFAFSIQTRKKFVFDQIIEGVLHKLSTRAGGRSIQRVSYRKAALQGRSAHPFARSPDRG